MATAFKQVKNGAKSTLSASITNSATSLTVATGNGTRFPTPGNPFFATIWAKSTYPDPRDDPNGEVVLVTAVSTDTFTITRGQDNTTGVAHASGDAIEILLLDQHFNDITTAVNTIENAGYVVGPASSTSGTIPYFSSSTGKLLAQSSGLQTNGSGSLTTSIGIGISGGGISIVGGTTTDGLLVKYAAVTIPVTLSTTNSFMADITSTVSRTVTLPSAVSAGAGRIYTIRKADSSANAHTVATTSSQTINGSTTYSLATQYKYVTVMSDGANWAIIGNN